METSALWAALIGVLTGVISSFVSHNFQLRLERQKALFEAENARKKDFKLEIAETVQLLMSMIQDASWVCWEVSKGKAEIDTNYLKAYNKTAKLTLNKIIKQLALLAATDIEVYQKVRSLAEEVYKIDLSIGNALVDYLDGQSNKNDFSTLKTESRELESSLPLKFAEVLKSVDLLKI